MTQEEKDLLLKDISARLPYGVRVKLNGRRETSNKLTIDWLYTYSRHIEDIKPYLRSMSSMTEEEKEELRQEHIKDEKLFAECLTKAANGDSSMRGKVIPHFAADWCNKNHFDYRGLIEKRLAIEAPKDMYNTK